MGFDGSLEREIERERGGERCLFREELFLAIDGNLNKRSSHQPLPTHPYNPLSDIRNLKNRSHSRAWGPVSERADTCQVSYDDREKSTVNIFRDFRSTTVGFKGRVELIPYSRRLVQVPSSECRAIPIG